MKFNLFLFLLSTLLAVASSKEYVFQIASSDSNKYWLPTQKTPYSPIIINLQSSGIWWKNVPLPKGSSHEIVVYDGQTFAGLAVTYNGAYKPLTLAKRSNPPNPNQLWEFDPVFKIPLAIQSHAQPLEFANKDGSTVVTVVAGLDKSPQWVLKEPAKVQSNS